MTDLAGFGYFLLFAASLAAMVYGLYMLSSKSLDKVVENAVENAFEDSEFDRKRKEIQEEIAELEARLKKNERAIQKEVARLSNPTNISKADHETLAKQLTYEGFNIYYWHNLAFGCEETIEEIWAVLESAGVERDGKLPVVDAVRLSVAGCRLPVKETDNQPAASSATSLSGNPPPSADTPGPATTPQSLNRQPSTGNRKP